MTTPTPPKSLVYATRWLKGLFFIFALVELANGLMALFFQDAAARLYQIQITDRVMTQQYGLALLVVAAAYAIIGLDPVAHKRLLFLPLVEAAVATIWTCFFSRGNAGGPTIVVMHFAYCIVVGFTIVIPTAILRNHTDELDAPAASS